MIKYTAIEIKNPLIAASTAALDPTLKELDYWKDLHMNFFVFGFPEPGQYSIVTPETFNEHFESIENGPTITLKLLNKK